MNNAKPVSLNVVNYVLCELLDLHSTLENVICTQLGWTREQYLNVWGSNLHLSRSEENAIVDLFDAQWAGFFEKMNAYRIKLKSWGDYKFKHTVLLV